MDVNSQLEKSCTALALLFQQVIIDMKNSTPVWEDFTSKATKLHSTLRSTVTAATAFLEAFQKVADMATSTKGATRDIGSALTRLCMRHRNIESKLKTVTSAIMDAMVMPLQEKMEDWKKVIVQLEKDRNRETKKSQQDIKKAVAETARLQKKLKKGRPEVQKPLEASVRDLREKLQTLEENEKIAVRAALTEERARYCLLIECIKPFMDGEISLLGDVTHLQEIMDSLCRQSVHPTILPEASEQIITDISTNESSSTTWSCPIISHQSPAHSMSSSKSSLSSLSSSSNSSSLSPGHRTCQTTRTNSESFADSLIDGSSSSSSTVNPGYSVMNPSICSHWPGSPPLRVSRQRDICDERPHTISTAYERIHARSALTSNTFQPPPFQVNSVPTTPNPHIMCMRAVRARPHSLIRNVELAKLFERGEAMIRRQEEEEVDGTGMTASVDSSITNRLQSHASISSAGDLMQSGQNLPCRGRNGREEGGHVSLRKRNHDLNTDKGCWTGGHPAGSVIGHQQGVLQQGKFTEPDDRKVSIDDVQQTVKARLIHHSLSCSVIVNEQLPTVDNGGHSNTNGNIYEHIYSEVPRRSSMFISERPIPPPPPSTRRLSSMVVCGDIVEDHTGQTLCFLDQHRTSGGPPHGGRLISGELNQSCSGPSHHLHRSRSEHRAKIDETTDHSEDFILPPSPFRSPDDLDDPSDDQSSSSVHGAQFSITDHRHVPQNFVMQGAENAAGERIMCGGQVWKTGGHERLRALDSEKEFLDERLRNPWQEMSTLLTMASPDDTTPTNENQPSIFAAASQKTHFVGCHVADGLSGSSVAEVVKDMDQMETGTNRESAI